MAFRSTHFGALGLAAILCGGAIARAHDVPRLTTPSADPTCASSGPCIEYQNTTSGGQGMEGVDNNGIGVLGTSHGASGVKGTATGGFGVYGAAGSGIGVKGTTAGTGTNSFGVIGYAGTAASDSGPYPAAVQGSSDLYNAVTGYSDDGYGVFARSSSSNGVVGQTFHASTSSSSAYGVWGEDLGTGAYNIGVYGTSSKGNGVVGTTDNPSNTTGTTQIGVEGEDVSTDGGPDNIGVFGKSSSGFGLAGLSGSGVGVSAVSTNSAGVEAISSSSFGVIALSRNATGVSTTGVVGLDTICGSPSSTDEIQGEGLSGVNYTVDCNGTVGDAVPTRDGAFATTTMARTTMPTIEDFGEAQLVNGRATVALDPTFAQTISASLPYLVFVTPDGDTNGLYVTSKTMQGFEVREVRGGTSSISFDYRIVARPAADPQTRMSLIAHLPKAREPKPFVKEHRP